MQQRREAVLIELHETHEHKGARQKMRDIEIEAAHQRLRETNSRSVARRPSIKARAEKFRNAEDAHFRDGHFEERRAETRRRRVCEIGGDANGIGSRSSADRRQSPGHEHAGDRARHREELHHRREIDQREMAAGIFEHHRFVHHGELEMRRRIVDRNARVLGDRDHDERDQRQAERDAEANVVRGHEGRDHGKLRRAREQRQREHDHQHRGLGERSDHDLARGADAAEARADIHAGKRQKEARAAEQRDDRDEIGATS